MARPGRKPPTFSPSIPVPPDAAADDVLLSLPRVAKLLAGVSVDFVRDLIHTGRLRGVVIARRLAVPRADVRRYVRELIEAQNPG